MKARVIVLVVPDDCLKPIHVPAGVTTASENFEGTGQNLHRLALQLAALAVAKFTKGAA